MPTSTARSVRIFPTRHFALIMALLLGGEPVTTPAGAPVPLRPSARTTPPTYHRDVEPILQARCQVCHRRGQVGPFPLETFEQAAKRGGDIAEVVEDRTMPPWKPVKGFGPKLAHDASMSSTEIEVVQSWVQGGMPEGDRGDSPSPRTFSEGWTLGTPDLILEPSEDYPLAARGPDVYRCFAIPTNLPADVYVSAVEYRPGNSRVVHHVMALVETAGQARLKDAADPGPGYSSFSGAGVDIVGDLGGWAAGNDPAHLPEGVGRSLPKGADVILQVHYHPSGKPEVDRTRIGLHFAKKPIRQTLQWVGVTTHDLQIPPDQNRVEVRATWTVPVDLEILSAAPHMHQLGRDMRITVTHPNGRTSNVLRVDHWDPAWQGTYSFAEPIRVVRGSIVEVVAHYDNSAHPRNPNHPPKLVKYGVESFDEMCVGYLGVVKTGQDLTLANQKDDLFAILLDQHRRMRYREQFNPARRRR